MDLYQLPYSVRSTYKDFYRLAAPLRAMTIDFDYAKTRKALDPKCDGYNIPRGHDVIADDVPLQQANLVTSRIAGMDLHRVVLDLDNGSALARTPMANRLTLHMKPQFLSQMAEESLKAALCNSHIVTDRTSIRWGVGGGMVDIYTTHDLALIPSSTAGHHHLILAVDMSWDMYVYLLNQLATAGIIERGYCKASVFKGYSAIRPPWVHK